MTSLDCNIIATHKHQPRKRKGTEDAMHLVSNNDISNNFKMLHEKLRLIDEQMSCDDVEGMQRGLDDSDVWLSEMNLSSLYGQKSIASTCYDHIECSAVEKNCNSNDNQAMETLCPNCESYANCCLCKTDEYEDHNVDKCAPFFTSHENIETEESCSIFPLGASSQISLDDISDFQTQTVSRISMFMHNDYLNEDAINGSSIKTFHNTSVAVESTCPIVDLQLRPSSTSATYKISPLLNSCIMTSCKYHAPSLSVQTVVHPLDNRGMFPNGGNLFVGSTVRCTHSLIASSRDTSLVDVSTVSSHPIVSHCVNGEIFHKKEQLSVHQNDDIVGDGCLFYGLPIQIQEMLAKNRKITKLYDWQDECLRLPAIYNGGNLIYTLPTSGGKTLVAEILIMRQILCKKKDAMLILPYVSIVQEKVRILSEYAAELGFLVEEYAGSKGRFPPVRHPKKCSLFVATIEKGQSLVNSFVECGRMTELGLVVVDELHMIGEGGNRGSALESTLLKVLHAGEGTTQIIGMSATLSNTNHLATFLMASIYCTDFRPVSLTEYVKVENDMYKVNNTTLVPEDILEHDKMLIFKRSQRGVREDPDNLLDLVMEIIPGNSCLVFCPTKRYCENVALMLAKLMSKQHRHLTLIHKEQRRLLLRELRSDGGGQLCPTLKYTVNFGIAYHHGGLTTEERRLIEDAYGDGVLCLLACTSTLAAGVNLPAKRVILRSPYVGIDLIKHSQYKQMTGRAGRAGIDSSGESILIARRVDMPKVVDMLSGPRDICHSSLMHQDGKGLHTLILSLVGLKMVQTTSSVFRLMRKTLLFVQSAALGVDVMKETRDALQYLVEKGLLKQIIHSGDEGSQEDVCLVNLSPSHLSSGRVSVCSTTTAVGHSIGGLRRGTTQDLFADSNISQAVASRTVEKGVEVGHFRPEGIDYEQARLLQTGSKYSIGVSYDKKTMSYVASSQSSGAEADSCQVVAASVSDFRLDVTDVGRATFKGCVDLLHGDRLLRDLRQARRSLMLSSHLHLLYLVTPYDLAEAVRPCWIIYLQQLGSLSVDEMSVATMIGVTENVVVKKVAGKSCLQSTDMEVVKRFYLTLMLYELWKQFSMWDVSERFQQPRGFVQNLLSSAASFACCVQKFCQELPELWAFHDILGNFTKRLAYCVSAELLPLMEVTGIKVSRAAQLYNAGYTSLQSLAAADSRQLVSSIQYLTHKTARQIIAGAQVLLEEKTAALLEQVEELVTIPGWHIISESFTMIKQCYTFYLTCLVNYISDTSVQKSAISCIRFSSK